MGGSHLLSQALCLQRLLELVAEELLRTQLLGGGAELVLKLALLALPVDL